MSGDGYFHDGTVHTRLREVEHELSQARSEVERLRRELAQQRQRDDDEDPVVIVVRRSDVDSVIVSRITEGELAGYWSVGEEPSLFPPSITADDVRGQSEDDLRGVIENYALVEHMGRAGKRT